MVESDPWSDEVGGQARHELDGACLGLGGEPVPDLGGRDDGIGRKIVAVS